MLTRKTIYMESSARSLKDSRAEELTILRKALKAIHTKDTDSINKARFAYRGVLKPTERNYESSRSEAQRRSSEHPSSGSGIETLSKHEHINVLVPKLTRL